MIPFFSMADFLKKNKNKKTDADTNNVSQIYVANAQSWAPDIHPNGIEDSTLVKEIDYKGNGVLDVEYRDGFKAEYNGISTEDAKAFTRDESKGRWALRNLWGKDYKQV